MWFNELIKDVEMQYIFEKGRSVVGVGLFGVNALIIVAVTKGNVTRVRLKPTTRRQAFRLIESLIAKGWRAKDDE